MGSSISKTSHTEEMRKEIEKLKQEVAELDHKYHACLEQKQLTTIQDITERKNMEDALKVEHSILDAVEIEAILSCIADGVVVYDRQGHIIRSNAAADNILKFHEEEKKLPLTERVPPRYKVWTEDGHLLSTTEIPAYRAFVYAETIKNELLLIEIDGKTQWINISAAPLYVSGKHSGGIVSLSDVSARKLAEQKLVHEEEALRKNEQRLQGVFDNAAIGIVEFDSEDRFIAVNDRSCEILGYKREELLGRNITEITAPEDLKQTIDLNARLHHGEFSIFDYEKRYIKRDGSLLWVHVTVSAVRDSQGKYINSIGTFEDISERKKIEQAISRNETILKQAGILANLGAWEIEYINQKEINKNPLHWSDQVYRIFGYLPGSATVNNALFYERVHPDDRQKVRQTIANAIAEKKSYSLEHRIIRADGIERIVIEHAEISYDKSGNPVRIIGAVQDITERKIEEEKLHEALHQAEEGRNILNALMEYIPIGISIADAPNAKVRMMSRYGQELLQISEKEIPNLPAPGHLSIWGTFHSDGVTIATPEELPLTRATMKSEIIKNEEWIIKRKSGTLVPVLCSAAPIFDKDGKVVGGVTGWQDIEERRRALKALEESEEKFRSLFENITEGVAIHELVYKNNKPVNYRILDVNPAFTEQTQIDQETARGALATDLYNSPDPPYLKEYSEVAITRKPYRFSIFYAPMNKHFVISAISPRKDQFATVFEDVTEQKKNEMEIKQKNEELTRFIYTVSHDLKSPLVTIKSFTSYLKEDLESNDKAAQDKDINYIQNAADKMGKLLDELLELSRVGRQEKPKTKATLKSIAQSAIDLVAGRLAKNKIKIQFTGPSVMLYGHTQRFIQLFQNLLDNSAKFIGDQPEPMIEIGSYIDETKNNEVVLFVRDNGSGIDPRYHHKIFGLFEKMDNKIEGTGIGLALIKRIVEVHGGSIWFESGGTGKGTTFYFTLEGTQIIN